MANGKYFFPTFFEKATKRNLKLEKIQEIKKKKNPKRKTRNEK